jgi:uncharacterized membrane protein
MSNSLFYLLIAVAIIFLGAIGALAWFIHPLASIIWCAWCIYVLIRAVIGGLKQAVNEIAAEGDDE